MAAFKFTDAVLEGRPIEINNGGEMRREFTFIDDAVAGTLATLDKVANRSTRMAIYKLGRGLSETLTRLVGDIEKKLDTSAKKEFREMQPGDVEVTYAEIEDAKYELGYTPKISMDEGILLYVDSYWKYYGFVRIY